MHNDHDESFGKGWNQPFDIDVAERVKRLPKPIEFIFNTPSHHRVHHGSNEVYLDRNYAGILVIWDRLFGSFEPEGERVRYGLTTNIRTFRPLKVAFSEYGALWHDIRQASGGRNKIAMALRGPGWRPDDGLGGGHGVRG